MGESLSHRGQDGDAIWMNDAMEVGFSHRRLAVIDLSDAGKQPMHYADRYTIIYNGEVYNYLELKSDLEKAGYQFISKTDTEVILAAYDHYKEDCVDHFDGMFAFAIWDEKEKILFAARDRFGEKPFHYYLDNEQFVFGSEMKALWAAGVPRILNQKMAFNYLTIGYLDNPNNVDETFFEQINKLPPAHFLFFSLVKREVILEKYWDIDLDNDPLTISDAEAIEQFDILFHNSVSKRFRSDVPIGTSLSGGLDSSSLVSASARLKPSTNSYDCFTAIFPGFAKDEMVFARSVAEQFNLKHHTTSPKADLLFTDLQKLIHHQEVPIGSSSVFVQYKVYELAKEHGIKVLLDGQGADETLAGYQKYYKWFWQELFRSKKLIGSKEVKKAKENGVNESFGFRNVVAALAPDFASVILEQQYLVNALSHTDLTKEFVQLQSKEAYYSRPTVYTLNGALYFNTCMHGLEELLHYADRNSMAHGREVRLPFLDHRLVEFIFSLSSSFKIRDGWTKWLLRKSMENSLPGNIVWRKDKVGFEPPQKDWMQHTQVQDAIMEAKKKLVQEKVLKPVILQKNPRPQDAFNAENYDWRYWMLAATW
jgi:asparagine synthase (glutamine-hydrolysing)